MIAVDTNVLVRITVGDDVRQARRAANYFANKQVWIGHTVLLETEWVLRARYDYTPDQIQPFFSSLLEYEAIQVEAPQTVLDALEIYSVTGEFADALHLARMPSEAVMLTFDKRFARAEDRKRKKVKVIAVGRE